MTQKIRIIVRKSLRLFPFVVAVSAMCNAGCQAWKVNPPTDRIEASNHRDWTPEFSKLPFAELSDDRISLHNIRNCSYVTESDFVVEHFNRTFRLDQVVSVDFIEVPFKNMPALAHTMLSFGLDDGTYLSVSVEIRTEKGELYNPLLGLARQYEITYVVADERDLIRLRTAHRDADVYVYPTIADPARSQQLLVDVLQRVNALATQPEFYNAITNNCTTNLARHVNQISPNRIPYNWKVLLPGFSARYAYDLGLLDNSVPFEELRELAYVNELAEQHFDDPQFSNSIRSGRGRLARLANREKVRRTMLDGGGADFLGERPWQPGKFR